MQGAGARVQSRVDVNDNFDLRSEIAGLGSVFARRHEIGSCDVADIADSTARLDELASRRPYRARR